LSSSKSLTLPWTMALLSYESTSLPLSLSFF
jgi:hypothetical protein